MRRSYHVRVVLEPYEVSIKVYLIDRHTTMSGGVLRHFVARRETRPALVFPFLSPAFACAVNVCAGNGHVLRGTWGKVESGQKNGMMMTTTTSLEI